MHKILLIEVMHEATQGKQNLYLRIIEDIDIDIDIYIYIQEGV